MALREGYQESSQQFGENFQGNSVKPMLNTEYNSSMDR